MNYNNDTLAQTGSNVETQTETLTESNSSRQEIYSVVTILGHEKCFQDESHPPRKPMLSRKAKSAPLVLHVDDDVDLVDAVTSRLAAAGYRASSALDGVSGVQEALRQSANAIILDYDMPNGRGDAVIELLKANDKTKDIPIIVLTAVHQKNLGRKLLNKGADIFMTKPFEFAELQANLKSLLEGDGN